MHFLKPRLGFGFRDLIQTVRGLLIILGAGGRFIVFILGYTVYIRVI